MKEFPLVLTIDWKELLHYKGLSISRSTSSFVDSFSIEVNNPWWLYSTTIPVWWLVEVYYANVLFFRWLIEKKSWTIEWAGSTLTLSWREELCFITEEDANPTLWPFKNKTDNELITLLLWGYWRKLELGTSSKIKEFDISGSQRIWQVIDDIVKYNDYFIYKRGKTIYKKKIPKEQWKIQARFSISNRVWALYFEQSRVMSMSYTEDITSCRASLTWYAYQQWKKKSSIYKTTTNSDIWSWAYASRLRNLSSLKWTKLSNRKWYVVWEAKDKEELEKQMNRAMKATDIAVDVTVSVYDFIDVDLLDTVYVQVETEKISQAMFISGIRYAVDSSNKRYTEVTLSTFAK